MTDLPLPPLVQKGPTTGHELVPPQEPARDHFSTDAAARKRNVLWGGVGWASRIGWNVAVGKFIEV